MTSVAIGQNLHTNSIQVAEYWIGEYVNVGGTYVNELVVVMS